VSSYVVTNDYTTKSSTTTQDQYSVGMKMDASATFLDVVKTTLKTSTSWQWTNSSTQGQTNESKQNATAKVGGPSYGYTGCGIVDAYYDRMYGTFVFAFDKVSCPTTQALIKSPSASAFLKLGGTVTGVVKNKAGQVATGTPVVLTQPGGTQRTYSDTVGEFVFFHVQPGVGQLSVGTVVVPVQNAINQIVVP
jgi:hypothetical protein